VTAARWLATFLAFTVLGALGGLLALMTVPRIAGYTPFTVLTGSMQPAYGVGDVVIDEEIAPLDARKGDVVTFHDPSRGGALVTHRVERVRTDGAKVSFVTKGDANSADERWAVAASGTIGRVRMRVPKVGWVLQWARGREGKLGLIVFPAVGLVLLELTGLVSLLRPRRREATA
jgi:signal peptidase